MFCSQCGRQIPDGSRFCNYCGTAIAVDDMNPDAKPNKEHYQDYSNYDTPKGFETLPYNKHGYDRQTTNSQVPQVPKGGFVEKDYTKQGQGHPDGFVQNDYIQPGQDHQYGFAQGDYTRQGQPGNGSYPGNSGYQQAPPFQPRQDFASQPAPRKKKWLLPVIIGGAVLLLALCAVLLFSCSRDDEEKALAEDPMLQANLSNWGYACKMGEDYYVAVPNRGLLRIQESRLRGQDDAPEPELIKAVPVEISGMEYTEIEDLVPAGKWLYYQINGYNSDINKAVYRYMAFDTESNRGFELFSVTGEFCYTIGKVEDRIYSCLDGDLFYVDTSVSPEKGEACKVDTNIRLGDDPNVAICSEGFLVAQQGNCRGLKLISPDNRTLRVYDRVQDQELYVQLVWNGYAYYRREDTADRMTIYRLDLKTGDYEVFASKESMGDPVSLRMNAYDDRIFIGAARMTDSGSYQFGIMQFYENGELRLEVTMPDAPDTDFSLLCMVNAGKYMITRLVLIPGAPTMHVYQLPDMQKLQ